MPIVSGVDASDSDRTVYPLAVDSDGHLQIDLLTSPVEVMGKNSNRIFAYESSYAETLGSNTLAAGNNTFTGTLVPAGKILVVTHFEMHYIGTITNVTLSARAHINANTHNLKIQKPPVSGNGYDTTAWICIPANGHMEYLVIGATVNDDAYLDYVGFYMNAP